jgi:hypothetical protein
VAYGFIGGPTISDLNLALTRANNSMSIGPRGGRPSPSFRSARYRPTHMAGDPILERA